jgi:multidrug resistance efflux pump
MRRRAIVGSGVTVLAVGGALLFLSMRGAGGGDIPTTAAVRSDFVHRIWADGLVQAAEATPLGPPPMTRGMMRIAWLAPDGTQVQPGDVVIRFDPTDLETRLLEGRTERATAEARIKRTQVREASAGKNLERDAKMAAVELDYAQKYQSKDPDVFSRVDIAKSEIDAKLAAARKDNAEEVRGIRGELAEVEIDLLGIERRKADLKVTQAEGDLKALEVRAPHAGIFTLRDQWGQMPRVGTNVWGGNAVAELPRLDALEAKVYVLEADAGGLKAGVAATVVVDGRPETALKARVRTVDTLAQPRTPDVPVQYFGAVLEFDEPLGVRVKPGQRVEATIVLEERAGAITVPRQAVFEADGRSVVYVRRGSRFEPKDVRLGPAGLGRQVIEDGVEPGELVALRDPTREANDEREERDEREGKDGSAVAGAPRRAGP